MLVNDTKWALFFIYTALFFSILVMLTIIFTPSFLKPAWLKWLELEHGEHRRIIEQEAKEIGLDVWKEKIKTDRQLKLWVEYVLYKHGLPNKNRLSDEAVPRNPFPFS